MISFRSISLACLLLATVNVSGLEAQSRRSDGAGRPSRLTVVEEELQSLRRTLADMSVKISVLEREIRSKTGEMEEAEYRNRQLQDVVEQLQKQVLLLSSDLRLLQEKGVQVAGSDPQSPPVGSDDLSGELPTGSDGSSQTLAAEGAPTVELPAGSAAEQFDFAFGYVRSNDLETGAKLLEDLIVQNKGDAVTGNAYYWLGRISLQQGRPADAARNLLQLLDEFPNHSKRAESYVDLAAALIDLKVPDEACDALYEFDRVGGAQSPRLVSRAKQLAANASCQ